MNATAAAASVPVATNAIVHIGYTFRVIHTR